MAKNLQHSYLPKLSVFQGACAIFYHKFCWKFRYKANYYSKYIQNKVKKVILDCQGEGETIEWEVDNFDLYKCKGLRASSNKRNKETVRYTQFF